MMSLDAGSAATGAGAPSGEWGHSGEWECMECGYIEEGSKTKRPRVCPDCGAPAQALEFFPFGDDEDEDDQYDEVSDDLEEDRFDDEDEELR